MGIKRVPSNVLDEDTPSDTPQWRQALEADAQAYKAKAQEQRDIKQAKKLHEVFQRLSLPFEATEPKTYAGGYTWSISNEASSHGSLIVQRDKYTAEVWLSDGLGTPLSAEWVRYFLLRQLDELDEMVAGGSNEPIR